MRCPGVLRAGVFHIARDQNLAGLGNVFAEFARRIHFRTEHVFVTNAQDITLAQADAQQDAIFRFQGPIEFH